MTDSLRHSVPTHLDTPDGVGNFSVRQLMLLVGTTFFVAPATAMYSPQFGPSLGDMIAAGNPILSALVPEGFAPVSSVVATALPIGLAAVAALPFEPPVEHGLVSWAKYRASQRDLGPEAIQELLGHPHVEGDVGYVFGEPIAMWQMPSVTLRLASDDARSVERARWASFLDGVPCPIQATVRCMPVDLDEVFNAMRASPNPNGALVAQGLRSSRVTGGEIERTRILAIRASTVEQLHAWAGDVDAALARAMLKGNRLEGEDLRDAMHNGFTRKPRKSDRIGPRIMRIEADGVRTDDEWVSTLALQRWPTTVVMDFLSSVYDGIAAIDVSSHIVPLDIIKIRRELEGRLSRLESTTLTRKRGAAIKQTSAMLDKIEDNSEQFFSMQVYLQVRARARNELRQRRRRTMHTIEEGGGQASHLRWEHPEGMLAAAGVLEHRLIGRAHTVDTSSASRAYPWGATELALPGGIPWGKTLNGNRRVSWTPFARPTIPNPNLAVYATSGGGKGFAVKVWTSRAILAGLLKECFFIDQAEESIDGEYGRWARYLKGEVRKLSREHWEQDLTAALADVAHGRLPPALVLNVAELSSEARCRVMAAFKRAVFARAAAYAARRCFGLDEMWTYAEDDEASAEGEDLCRRGRHVELCTAYMTQRPMDALDSRFGRTVQSLCATQWYGMQMPAEISDVATRLRWTAEQQAIIERLGQGEAMLVAGLHRVVYRVDYTAEEWDNFHTDFVEPHRTQVLVDHMQVRWDSGGEGRPPDAAQSDRHAPVDLHPAGGAEPARAARSLPDGPLDSEATRLLIQGST